MHEPVESGVARRRRGVHPAGVAARGRRRRGRQAGAQGEYVGARGDEVRLHPARGDDASRRGRVYHPAVAEQGNLVRVVRHGVGVGGSGREREQVGVVVAWAEVTPVVVREAVVTAPGLGRAYRQDVLGQGLKRKPVHVQGAVVRGGLDILLVVVGRKHYKALGVAEAEPVDHVRDRRRIEVVGDGVVGAPGVVVHPGACVVGAGESPKEVRGDRPVEDDVAGGGDASYPAAGSRAVAGDRTGHVRPVPVVRRVGGEREAVRHRVARGGEVAYPENARGQVAVDACQGPVTKPRVHDPDDLPRPVEVDQEIDLPKAPYLVDGGDDAGPVVRGPDWVVDLYGEHASDLQKPR